jgi:hypothetical protein
MTLYNSKRKVSKITIAAVVTFIVSLGGLIVLGNRGACWAWNAFAVPDVEKRITAKVEPVKDKLEDALIYNSALHEATMTPAQIGKAEAIYESKKKGHLSK